MSIAGIHLPNDWITSRFVIEALGEFDLDPCQSPTQPWPCAKRGYVLANGQDGLVLPWQGRVWLNPPYGPHAPVASEDGATPLGHRVGVRAHRHDDVSGSRVPSATAILFLKGRLHFHKPDGTRADHNSGGPSCLISWSQSAADVLRTCGLPGRLPEIPPPIDDTAEE
ncbi:MAG: hypothetical protein AB7G08_11320 [Hyphomicrobiaceae bacterium]